MPRLTRSESQAQTRERLLESAKRVFLREGYVRTSLEKVADEAGYSKGAVYSNFEGKEALFLELLKRKFETDIESLRQLYRSVDKAEDLLAAVCRYHEGDIAVLEFTAIAVEFLTQVSTDSPYGKACAVLYDEQRKMMAELITTVAGRLGVVPPVSPIELATELVGLTLGLAIQRSIDPPAVSAALWGRAVEQRLRGLLMLSGSRTGRAKNSAR
jgi:AcrR family transcriptional regulator